MSAIEVSVSSKRYRPRASSSGENLHSRASTAFLVRSAFDLRTLLDVDFLGLDWRADARDCFAMAKTPMLLCVGNVSASRIARICEPGERYTRERHAVKDYFPVSRDGA
ncbi:MAG TPA: hypothetical protein VFL53_19625 [Pseudolabrys sp.]|nr:hypothetical protein [Pseudolabrys sp.]